MIEIIYDNTYEKQDLIDSMKHIKTTCPFRHKENKKCYGSTIFKCTHCINTNIKWTQRTNESTPLERALERLEERHKNHEKMLEHYRQTKDLDSAVKQSRMKCENEIAIEIIKGEIEQ